MSDNDVRIVVDVDRRARLLAFGFGAAFIDALAVRDADPIARSVWFSSGEVLAEIVAHAHVRDRLPKGTIVPVCQVDESSLHYVLLLFTNDQERAALVEWTDESCAPIRGGVLGFLTDTIVQAWEAEVDEEALVAWGNAMGHPAMDALVEALAAHNEDPSLAWVDAFVADLTKG